MLRIIGLLLAVVAGFALGRICLKQKENDNTSAESMLPVNRKRSNQREQNLKNLLRIFDEKDRVRNSDVKEKLDVSPKTVRNYFNELADEGLITQHGDVGRDVYYTLNR